MYMNDMYGSSVTVLVVAAEALILFQGQPLILRFRIHTRCAFQSPFSYVGLWARETVRITFRKLMTRKRRLKPSIKLILSIARQSNTNGEDTLPQYRCHICMNVYTIGVREAVDPEDSGFPHVVRWLVIYMYILYSVIWISWYRWLNMTITARLTISGRIPLTCFRVVIEVPLVAVLHNMVTLMPD